MEWVALSSPKREGGKFRQWQKAFEIVWRRNFQAFCLLPLCQKKANRTFKKLFPCLGGMGGSAAEGQSWGGLEMGGGRKGEGKEKLSRRRRRKSKNGPFWSTLVGRRGKLGERVQEFNTKE